MAIPLTIIIPAKHEEQSIGAVVKSITKHVKTPHRIIVVCDTDRQDQTYMMVPKHIRVIHRINIHGTFGSALALGIAATKTPYVVPVMADLCDDPKDIDTMFSTISEGWDVVCASRYMKGGKKIGGPAIQSFFSWFVCTSLRFLTEIPTHDISNAYKMYKTEVIKNSTISETSGVEVSMEIILQAFYSGATITEIPTTWIGRKTGRSKFKFIQQALGYIRIYFWALTHKASPHPGTFS